MIDWHSHILPCMDDGSKDTEESIALLKTLSEQGVRKVIATPHFFANDETVGRFLERRAVALEKLSKEMMGIPIEIVLGAEVKYYQGISRLDSLRSLCIGDSKLLLLEMSFSKWTEYTIKEIIEMASTGKVTVVLAHVERFLKFQSKSVWKSLYDSGILMQVNANFFNDFLTRKKALKMLEQQKIQFVGSDCHDIKTRPPKIGTAYDIIRNNFGDEFLEQMNDYGYSVLS